MLSISSILLAGDLTVSGDEAADSLEFSVTDGGLLRHDHGGLDSFHSNLDFDSSTPGDQTIALDDLTSLSYTDAGANDTVNFGGTNDFNFSNVDFAALSVTALGIGIAGNTSIDTQGATTGDVSLNASRSVSMNSGSSIETDGGAITLKANMASTTPGTFRGVELEAASITSATGDIVLAGHGGDTGSDNYGVYLVNGTVVESTGENKTDAATVTIDGTGGDGSKLNTGVALGGTLYSVAGDVAITGRGGNGTEGFNYGVFLLDGAAIESSGTSKADAATITINGTGGDGPGVNPGVSSRTTSLRSVAGDIAIIGHAGDGSDKGSNGVGIQGLIESTGASKADAAAITIDGTGDVNLLATVRSVAGDVGIRGQGGSIVIHDLIESTGLSKADAASITIDGMGPVLVDSAVRSVAGDIELHGHGLGGTNGVRIDGGLIESIGTSKADAAKIMVEGTGGAGGTDTPISQGVAIYSNARISSVAGDVAIRGQGGDVASEFNTGVYISEATVESTGERKANAARISIDGTGGEGTQRNHGVYMQFLATIESVAGDIVIKGEGGDGTDRFNVGVVINNGRVNSTGATKDDAAEISIEGTGGKGTTINHGVVIQSLSTAPGSLVTSVAGDIKITGHGGQGVQSGVILTGLGLYSTGTTKADAAAITIRGTAGPNGGSGVSTSADIRSVAGDVEIVGQAGDGSGSFNLGVNLGGAVLSTGRSKSEAATIAIQGKGGIGTSSNHGVSLHGTVRSVAGDIAVAGQGGSGSEGSNIGVRAVSGVLESTGISKADAAKITIDGTGGQGGWRNFGVYTGTVRSVAGDIAMTGLGGDGPGGFNVGSYLLNSVKSTGTSQSDAAHITIKGNGGNGTNYNYGVWVARGSVLADAGDILAEGKGGGEGTENHGVFVTTEATISAAGGGHVRLAGTGTSEAGASGRGVLVTDRSVVQTVGGGTIDLTGAGSGGDPGIEVTGVDAGPGVVALSAATGIIREAEDGTDVRGRGITIDGTLAPSGTVASGQAIVDGDLTLVSGDIYAVELNGTAAATDYDQLKVIGTARTVDLGGSTLDLTLGFTPSLDDEFVLLDNADADSAISGTFQGLAEGTTFALGGKTFRISYQGGDDENDVVLTTVTSPPAIPVDNDTADNNAAEGAATGTTVGITASSTDPEGASITYSLADDAGGRFMIGPLTGVVTVADGSLLDGPASHTISIEANDGAGGSATADFTVTIDNVAPNITALTSDAPITDKSDEGEQVTISAAFTDEGVLDTHTASIDWGDGTMMAGIITESAGSGTVGGSHAYDKGGIYTIEVTVSDDDAGKDAAATTAFVTGVGVNNGVLQVVGTIGDDHVTIERQGRSSNDLGVHAGFLTDRCRQRVVNGDGVTAIEVVLGEGNDRLDIADNIELPTLVDVGDGDDQVNGGGGSDVILGRGGDDVLNGSGGRDILLGGFGLDRLAGGRGDDILFGGVFATTTDADGKPTASYVADWAVLRHVRTLWTDPNNDAEARKGELEMLDAFFGSLIDDGSERDQLIGAAGGDWFLFDRQ